MFSVVFPGQGSQKVGMAKEFFDKFEIVKNKVNNQYSDLDALSEKLVYFTKQIFIASKKFILVSPYYGTFND